LFLVALVGVPIGVTIGSFPQLDAFVRKIINGGKAVPIPDWVTRSGYTENIESRTKAGDAQSQLGRIGVLDLRTGDARWVDVPPRRAPSSVTLASGTFQGSVSRAQARVTWS
jgi:hypothetical protein